MVFVSVVVVGGGGGFVVVVVVAVLVKMTSFLGHSFVTYGLPIF